MYMNDGNKTKINLRNKSVFITGVAGFIGSNLAKRLLSTVEDVKVVGLDNMNHYYDVRLKEARLNELEQFENFSFVKGNLADKSVIEAIFEQYKPEIVVNLGAQAGVRYSITNPDIFVQTSDNEGKSLVLDEAKILHCPVVVTNYMTVADAVSNEKNGLIADFDPQSVAQCIMRYTEQEFQTLVKGLRP